MFPKTRGSYKIKKNETLSGIAKDRGTTVAKLMKMNPGIKDKNKIRAGAGLRVPPMPIKTTAKDKSKAQRGRSDFGKMFGPTPRQKARAAALKKNQMAKKRAGGVMKAMGGKMAKGYSKGGARKMMTASGGNFVKRRASLSGSGMSAAVLKRVYNMAQKNASGDRLTVKDINNALQTMKKKK